MQFHILTLFPEMVENGLQTSILGRAIQKGLIGIHAVNIRDYTQDKHNKVDDYPYGGGAGMLMQAQPVYDAWKAVAKPAEGKKPVRVLFMSPQGKTFSQEMAKELAQLLSLRFDAAVPEYLYDRKAAKAHKKAEKAAKRAPRPAADDEELPEDGINYDLMDDEKD